MLLSEIIVGDFDVFVVSSHSFWVGGHTSNHSRVSFVLQFFEALRAVNGTARGLLVARDARTCAEASTSQHGMIPCVHANASEYHEYGDLDWCQFQRWAVIEHFIARGQRIACAGADVRFLRPLAPLYAELSAASVDVAFEGEIDARKRTVRSFTPDLIAALPTPRAISFVQTVRAAFQSFASDPLSDLPPDLRGADTDALLRTRDIGGPAQQSVLHDALLSALYGTHAGGSS